MILYFSGTGNSEYAAKRIAAAINDEALNLFEKIKNHDNAVLHSERPWVIVAPTYAWRIPRILQSWLEKTELTGSRTVYFVMTCGGNIGNAGKYTAALCAQKGLEHRGCFGVVMPENYVAMFPVPDEETARIIIRRANKKIDWAAELISSGEAFPQPPLTMKDKISSGVVNQVFYPMFVHARQFRVTDACISCGKCAKLCPTSNIRLEHGKPVWGGECTHCMACICHCPTAAIEYGKHSVGKPRYTCLE